MARCQGMVVAITVAEVRAAKRQEQPHMKSQQREVAREEVQEREEGRGEEGEILQEVHQREVSARGRRKRLRRSCVVCGGEGVLEVEGMDLCESCLSAQ